MLEYRANIHSMEKFPQDENKVEKGKIFESITFEKIINKGKLIGYKSDALDRKRINLPAHAEIEEGKPYNVIVQEDTEPDDPMKGKYIVRLMDSFPTDPMEREKIETDVNEAENAERNAIKSSVELYEETGMQQKTGEIIAGERKGEIKKGRNELDPEQLSKSTRRPRVTKKGLEREAAFKQQAEELLGPEGSYERSLAALQYLNLVKALREERKIDIRLTDLRKEEAAILKDTDDEPSGSELEALQEIRNEVLQVESEKEALYTSNPEAFYGLHLKDLKKYKEDLVKGKIVETPYVEDRIHDVVSHLEAHKPVMIYGHLGSGKTELALHVARNYVLQDRPDIDKKIEQDFQEWSKNNPKANAEEQKKYRTERDSAYRSALVISGSKNMSTSELYGHQILTVDEESGATKSDFYLGPIYKAMEEGRPVIIDEVNAIPHEVLISLNHLLTRQPGDEVNVQQDSGRVIRIKEGFGIIMTGNLNQGQKQYIDRQDMDPAFLSRLYKMEYDYLPQSTEGSMEAEAGNEEGDNELFLLLLARVMDGHGNIEAPVGTAEKLWDLAKAARITQNVFSGKEVKDAFYFKEAAGRNINYMLKEAVLSLRNIDKIITQWQSEGYKYELDYYIYKEFIAQSTVAADRAYLYQVFKDQFGFFQNESREADTTNMWEQTPSYGKGGIVTSFDVKVPKNPAEQIEFMGPRDTVELAYGSAPLRQEWPKVNNNKAAEGIKVNKEIIELQNFKEQLAKDLEELAGEIDLTCPVE
jgi:MoxR-like ATPase